MTASKLIAGSLIVSAAVYGSSLLVKEPKRDHAKAKTEIEAKFSRTGKYEPSEEKDGISVQTYDGPEGKGYLIIEDTADGTIITDYGNSGRSQFIPKAASSTP